MPDPIAGETRDEFIDRCVPEVLEDGTADDNEQAVAVCSSIWEESDVEVESEDDPATHRMRTKGAKEWWSSPFFRIPEHGPQIDSDRGILRNVAAVSVGEAKGHGVQLDGAFIEDVVRLGNEASRGVKVRFTHPNASGSALGTYLGRAKNFRVDGAVARCDIQLSETAKQSPKGNLYDYVLSMADKNPDMFGASIVFRRGDIKDVEEGDEAALADLPIATIQKLTAVDLVDDPAANPDGLFSSGDQMAARATDFFDQHPEIYDAVMSFLDANPDIWDMVQEKPQSLTPFLVRYEEYRGHQEPKATEEGSMPEPSTPEGENEELSTPAAPVTPEAAPAPAKADRGAELKKINDQFGANALAQAVAGDLTFEQARDLHYAALADENKALKETVEELSAAPADGEEEPLGFGAAEGDEEAAAAAAKDDKVKRLSTIVGSEGTARFAASLKLAD